MSKSFWVKQPRLKWVDLTGRFEVTEHTDGTLSMWDRVDQMRAAFGRNDWIGVTRAAIKVLNKNRGSHRLMTEVLGNDC